jgi:hypothetical protein
MKKPLIILFSVGLALGASAQRGHIVHGGGFYSRPRIVVGVGVGAYSPFYPYYGFGYGPFSPFGYPYGYPGYGHSAISTKLASKIEDIKNAYQAQIDDTRNDKSLTGKEKRQKVREIKHEREEAITQAKRDYYDDIRQRYNNKRNDHNGNNDNNKNKTQDGDNGPEYNDNGNGR